MDKLNEVQIFKTGSTIANGGQLTDVAVNKYKTAIDGLNLSQAQAALSTTALNEAQQKQILTAAGLITSVDSVTAAEVKQAVSENVLTTAKQQEVLAVFEQRMAEGQLSVERLQAIASENTEADAVARVILAKKGENAQNLKNIASGKALNVVLKEQFLLLLKNPLTWVAVAVVGVVALTKAIENSIVTEEKLNEEIEELNSNWSELSSTIQNSAQSFQSLKKSADELIPRYVKLAQGVDKYGNNVSLTDEEFEEFVSLNNQLGQMFPELVMGYDSNGNAILSLSGNVNTLTESLYSLVEAQRLASAQTIADTMPDVMSNIDSTVETYNSKIQLIEDEKKSLEDLYNTFKDGGFVEEWSSVGESMISAVKILDKYGIDYNSEITGERNGVVGSTRYKITVDWDDFETAYSGKIAGFEKQTNDIIGRIESKWKQLNPVVSAWLSTDYLYQDLESNGQNLVTAMVGAIDFKSLGLTTEQEVQNYISNSIISPIYDMDTATQNAFFKIFDLHEALDNGELSVQEYQKEINNILENGNYSQEFVSIFRMAFAEDNVQTKYNATLDRFKDEETQSLDELKTKYQEAIDKRKELYSGEHYVGNVDINNRPVVINDDGSYSTTSTSFQDEETGSYKIIHYTPILPDGTILEDDALNEYIDKILNSSDSLKADNPANGGYGIVYKVDTEVNGQKITDDNLDTAFGIADAWDVEMHEFQDKMYRDEAEYKAAIEKFTDPSADLEKFFTDNSINTEEEIDYFNKVTEGAKTAAEAIQMYTDAIGLSSDPIISLETLNEQIDSIQSAYKSLTTAVEEYNQHGYVSADTLQALLELDSQYLACLIDENGQLKINGETYQNLARAKLAEAEAAAVDQAIEELGKVTTESSTSANVTAIGVMAEKGTALVGLSERYAALADVAISAAKAQALADAYSKAAMLNQAQANQVMSNLNAKLALIHSTSDNISKSFGALNNHMNGFSDASKSASDSAGDAKDAAKDWFDFMERRIEVLTNAFENLEKGIENVMGAGAKNQLVDAQIGIYKEEINNYTDALAMYKKMADDALSSIDNEELRKKIKDGAVELDQIQGTNAETVKSAMEEYTKWADKIQDCSLNLEELKTNLRQLELDKFTNIAKDFTDQFDIRESSIDTIESQIGLLEESGELIGKYYYEMQKEQAQKQLEILQNEKTALVNQFTNAIKEGSIQQGTEEWIEMQQQISDVNGEIIECQTSIEKFDNAINDINYHILELIQTEYDNLSSQIETLIDLYGASLDINVSDGNGTWTDDAIAALGLYAQQYEINKRKLEESTNAITQLEQDYKDGKISDTEYLERLAEYVQAQHDAALAAKDTEDAIIDLNETRINEEIDAINKATEAYKEFIYAEIEALEAEKELNDYKKSIAEKNKDLSSLERKRAALEYDDSAYAKAQKALLDEEIANKREEIADAENEHELESKKDSLNKQYEEYEKAREAEIEALEESLKDRENIISQSLNTVKTNTDLIGSSIVATAQQHGILISDALVSSWNSGSNAVAGYGEVLSAQSSAFTEDLINVGNGIYALQDKANTTSYSIASMFSNRADVLVGELVSSYSSIDNLNNMTNILQNSLINTLERGYNIGSLVDGLNEVAAAAGSAAGAIDSLMGALTGGTPTSNLYSPGNAYQSVYDHANKTGKANPSAGSWKTTPSTSNKQNQAIDSYMFNLEKGNSSSNNNTSTFDKNWWKTDGSTIIPQTDFDKNWWKKTSKYAKGGIVSKKDSGVLDPIARSLGEDRMVAVQDGEGILTPSQTEAFVKMAQNIDLYDYIPKYDPQIKIPELVPISHNVSLHYDKMFEFNGDFNNSEELLSAMKKVAKNTTTKILDDINRDYKMRH